MTSSSFTLVTSRNRLSCPCYSCSDILGAGMTLGNCSWLAVVVTWAPEVWGESRCPVMCLTHGASQTSPYVGLCRALRVGKEDLASDGGQCVLVHRGGGGLEGSRWDNRGRKGLFGRALRTRDPGLQGRGAFIVAWSVVLDLTVLLGRLCSAVSLEVPSP